MSLISAAYGKVSVFGSLKRKGKVYAQMISDVKENTLIQDGTFHLPGEKALLSKTAAVRKIAVDVTESPVERPKKNKKSTIAARKSGTR
jgi:hypothetical protein